MMCWSRDEIEAWAARTRATIRWEFDAVGPGEHILHVSGARRADVDELRRNRNLFLILEVTPLPEEMN